MRSRRLAELKTQTESKIKPEGIDWGYCIPDCGICCGAVPPKLPYKPDGSYGSRHSGATLLYEDFNIDPRDLGINPDRNEVYEEYPCRALYGPSLCLLHEDRKKPTPCSDYTGAGCSRGIVREVQERGYHIKQKLKKMWSTEYKKSDYNKWLWLEKAEATVLMAKALLDGKDPIYQQPLARTLKPGELDKILDRATQVLLGLVQKPDVREFEAKECNHWLTFSPRVRALLIYYDHSDRCPETQKQIVKDLNTI